MIGLKFGEKHSHNDYGLILTSKDIGFPTPKVETIDIPHSDGSLDFTSEPIKFKNRKLSFEFAKPEFQKNMLKTFDNIASEIHGQKMKITLDDDAGYYYFGRCTITSFQTLQGYFTFKVDVDAEPYRLKQAITEKILSQGINTLPNGQKAVVPQFETSDSVTIAFNDKTFTHSKGNFKIPEIEFTKGDNILKITGGGTVKITYQEGDL